MAQIIVKPVTDQAVWEAFLAQHPEANFLQSWYWGLFHQALHKTVYYSGFYETDTLVGVMVSVVEPAKRGRYLTVPAGPIIDWKQKSVVKAFVEEITRIAKQEKCVFVRVRPQLVTYDFSVKLFSDLGFKSAPIHLHAELTSQLDITKSEDELMAGMRKATRYEVRKAMNNGVSVTATTDVSSIKKFYDLQLETARRQKFVPFSLAFLEAQFKIFAQANKALLYSAYHEKKLLAQAFIIFYGQEAAYHYGASTEDGRKFPGAYLIQWEAIKEAKKRGLTRYNFWGVSPEDQKDHRFYGISVFKRGFGGNDVDYLHAQDLIMNKPRYLLNLTVESLRKKIRRV